MLLVLSGCTATDPLSTHVDQWRPNGANDKNLAAMVADPLDLVNGAASPIADGSMTVAAVTRYRAGKTRALPESGLSKIGGGGSAGGGGAALTGDAN